MVSVLVSSGTLCFLIASVTAGETGFSGKIEAPGIFKLSKKGFRNYSVIFTYGTLSLNIASVTGLRRVKRPPKGHGVLGGRTRLAR